MTAFQPRQRSPWAKGQKRAKDRKSRAVKRTRVGVATNPDSNEGWGGLRCKPRIVNKGCDLEMF